MINLSPPLSAEASFYVDLQTEYTKTKSALETEVKNYNTAINSLIKDLQGKKEKPFDRLEVTTFTDNKTELAKAVTSINTVIKKNNQRTTDFDIQKEAAVEKLKDHFAAEFETAENYSATLTAIAAENVKIEAKKVSITTQKGKVLEIENKLSETVKGAETVNDYLKIFFSKDDIKIESTADKKFKLLRGGQPAKNLSEGEKTAISFAYFTAKLEERTNKIADFIIFIDDPISSLDSNHLFNLYSFIRNKFYDPTTKTAKCKQLFISTHNFEFYNLVYDWVKVRSIGKNKQSFYLVERSQNSHSDESSLKASSHLIEKFKSEYAYLFSIILEFHQKPSDKDKFEQLYHLPNILRRFLETYLNFKYLTSINIEESIELLIKDPVKCERARKFVHYYSHGLSTEKFMKLADLTECSDVVKIIVEAVETDDPVHYKSLTDSLIVT